MHTAIAHTVMHTVIAHTVAIKRGIYRGIVSGQVVSIGVSRRDVLHAGLQA